MICKFKKLLPFLLILTILQPPVAQGDYSITSVLIIPPSQSVQLVYASSNFVFANALLTTSSPVTIETKTNLLLSVKRFPAGNGQSNACSCLKYATSTIGVHFGVATPLQVPLNAKKPTVGALAVTYEGSYAGRGGHATIVEKVLDDGIVVKESNFSRCRITSGRFIAFSSGVIRGYYVKE